MIDQTDLRPSPIAGQWYPGNASLLREEIGRFIELAELPALENLVAIIVPHAGYRYSGPVAGHAFASVRGMSPKLVAVISPMHHAYPQALLTSGHAAYATPLGVVPIDHEAVQRVNDYVEAELGFGVTPVREDDEHSLEIELPFLQQVFETEFDLLPVMMRDQSPRAARVLGKALAAALRDRDSLLVASSDLSHFYPQREAVSFDQVILDRIADFDPEGVLRAEEEGKGFACGRGAIAAVLWASKELGADKVQILNYATSGDVSGDYHRVVGYAAAAIVRSN